MPGYAVESLTCSYGRGLFGRLGGNGQGYDARGYGPPPPGAALSEVSFEARPGELVVVFGEGGAGKTSLLRALAGLLPPLRGRILEDGRDITGLAPHRRDIAMVFQNFSLYPGLTVFDNLAFPLRGRRQAEADIKGRVEETARTLGLSDMLPRFAHELSGGELQRVALGRALIRRPKLFLLDDPLSSLDAKLKEQMRAYIRRLQRFLQVTMIFSTHDHEEAMALGDRLLILHRGRLIQEGRPDRVYQRPVDSRVARMLGSPPINLLSPREAALIGLPDGVGRLIGVRPEHVRLSRGNGARGRVVVGQHLGHASLLLVEQEGVRLRALVEAYADFREGDVVEVEVDLQNVHAFER